jgi:hypothetical protein
MSFRTEEEREEREVLKLEYETLHKENWERGQNIWLVNTILITGSLIVSFQSDIRSFPVHLISIFLVIVAFLIHATAGQVTSITYRRMEKIRESLRMTGPTIMYHRDIEPKLWYSVRRNMPYVLYLVLGCVYLFLITGDIYIFADAITAGFLIILFREGLHHTSKH